MIIGGSKKQVIKNIQQALDEGNLNKKVENGDPSLSPEEKESCFCGIKAAERKENTVFIMMLPVLSGMWWDGLKTGIQRL